MNWNSERIKILEEAFRPMSLDRTDRGANSLSKVVTPTALIIKDGDVVKTYLHANVEVDDEAAEYNIERTLECVSGKGFYHLLVADPTTHVTVEVRNYHHEEFESLKLAEAIVLKSLAHRILTTGLLAVRKHRYPTKIFDCESEALKWFNELRKTE